MAAAKRKTRAKQSAPKLVKQAKVPHGLKPVEKVAIVGFASSSRDDAPFQDESWDIWICNELYRLVPRWNRLFEYHTREHLDREREREGKVVTGEEHVGFLKSVKPPDIIYMQDVYPDIPASAKMPRLEMDQWMLGAGHEGDPYWTSTPSYQIALAMCLGAKEIGLYGVDLLDDEEYAYQRPGMEYIVGLARGRGIKVHIPKASALCKANYIYGVTEPPEKSGIDKLVDNLNRETKKMQQHLGQVQVHQHSLNGAMQAMHACAIWLKHQGRGGEVGLTTEEAKAKEIAPDLHSQLMARLGIREGPVQSAPQTTTPPAVTSASGTS